MKIVIIEDEQFTAEDLKEAILNVAPHAEIVAMLQSVSEAVRYFKKEPMPQLIFSDIQLGDGQSFEIFEEVDITAPVIFCTAFDEYAIEAFNSNGIHYVLKPFNDAKIKEALDKYSSLQHSFAAWSSSMNHALDMIDQQEYEKDATPKVNSLLVYYQNKIIPIKLEDVALFYIKNDTTLLHTYDGKNFVVNKTLDELQQLDTDLFYRANRQYIVNRNAIQFAENQLSRKVALELSIPFEETITISKMKASHFFEWLSKH